MTGKDMIHPSSVHCPYIGPSSHPSICAARLGPKPTFLYSNYRWVEKLYLPLPEKSWDAEMSVKHLDHTCIQVLK
jgi:hypothetical protein